MKPAMRPDAYPVSIDDGAYVLTHSGPVRLAGSTVAQWIERIAPHLDGTRTLAELTANLPAARREMVERVVSALHDAGVVRDAGAGLPASAPLAEQAVPDAPPEVAFADYFLPAGAEAYARYRDSVMVVIGDGALPAEIVRAARDSGLRWVREATGENLGDGSMGTPGQGGEDPAAGAAVVLHVVEEAARNPAQLVEQCCAHRAVPVLHVILDDGAAWLAMACDPTETPWSAAWHRRAAAPAAPPGTVDRDVTAVAVTAVATQAVHHVFRALTGAGDRSVAPEVPDGRNLVRIDLGTLRTTRHRFLPHPYARPARAMTADEFEGRWEERERGDPLTEQELSERAGQCVDERLGLLILREHDWAQAPLHVSEAVVTDPVCPPGHREAVSAVGAGFSHRSARCRAALRGLARYAELMVDPRRLVYPDGPAAGRPRDPARMLAALRAGGPAGHVWGRELHGARRVRLLPTSAAFPSVTGRGPEHTTGVAAGYDWQQAIQDGLLSHCRRLTVQEALSAASSHPRVDPAATELDGEGARSLDLLTELECLPEVYDLTGRLAVPTYAFCLGKQTVACASGMSPAEGLRDGLSQVLLAVQARTFQQVGYLPAAEGELSPRMRGTRCPESAHPEQDLSSVAARLHEAGHVPVAVPLDHDPEVAKVMPYLVHVVMADD